MAETEQELKSVLLNLGDRLHKKISYYKQDVKSKSPNLGTELAKYRSNGPRQRLGIYTPLEQVVWSNDPQVSNHYYLTLAENTPRASQFQTTKYPGEHLARIYVAGTDMYALMEISRYILNSEPSPVQRIILNLVSSYTSDPGINQEIFAGTTNQLRLKISDLK